MEKNRIDVLAISYRFPPLAFPRSVQVARLLKFSRCSFSIVCGESSKGRDFTIEPKVDTIVKEVFRIPFYKNKFKKSISFIAYMLHFPLLNKCPDELRSWSKKVIIFISDFIKKKELQPQIIVTFSHPLSDHLVGLTLKKLYKLPWIAYFGDAWVDLPWPQKDSLTKKVNLKLEKKVIENADYLIFTSEGIMSAMMKKYPIVWKKKCSVLPPCYDSDVFDRAAEASAEQIIIRHLGTFYGKRTPEPLFKLLREILKSTPELLKDVQFELIGQFPMIESFKTQIEDLPKDLIVVKPPVTYKQSIELMTAANGLLVIHSFFGNNIRCPAKLADYIGAGRPIAVIGSDGPSLKIAKQLGGWEIEADNKELAMKQMIEFITYLKKNRYAHGIWGKKEIREQFSALNVAEAFDEIIEDLV